MQTKGQAGSVRAPETVPAPVFVDASGRRRKLLRRVSIGAVGVLCGYGCLLGISFAGGPVPPDALLPVPGVPGAKAVVPVRPDGSPAASGAVTASASPSSARPGVVRTVVHSSVGKPRPKNSQSTSANAAGIPQPGLSNGATAPLPTTAPQPTPTSGAPASSTHGPPATPPGKARKTPTSGSTS